MVCGAEVFAVAVPAGGAAAGDAILNSGRGGWRGDVGDCVVDEYWVPRDVAGSIAGCDGAYFLDAAGFRRYSQLRSDRQQTGGAARSEIGHARGVSTGADVLCRRCARGGDEGR